MPDIKLFAGNATPELAKKISERLYISLGDATFPLAAQQFPASATVKLAFSYLIRFVARMFSFCRAPVLRRMTT